jgi:hypothetical protein
MSFVRVNRPHMPTILPVGPAISSEDDLSGDPPVFCCRQEAKTDLGHTGVHNLAR